MSAMRDTLRDYLTMRRALGFKLVSDGTGLLSFVAFLEQAQAEYISTALALAWAQIRTSVQSARWAVRLGFVRSFARYCSAIDPRTEIPPVGLLPFEYRRRAPYFFSDKDIEALLRAALALPARDSVANHDLSLLARPAQCHRTTCFRGGQSHAGRCRFGRWHPDHPFLQVWKVQIGSTTPFHHDGFGRLPETAGSLPRRPTGSILVRQ